MHPEKALAEGVQGIVSLELVITGIAVSRSVIEGQPEPRCHTPVRRADAENATLMNKAYLTIVREQSYTKGRDARCVSSDLYAPAA